MSWTWFKNIVGASLSDEEMRDIPRPYLELTIHVTDKCIEAFGLLGTCVVGPASAMLRSSTRNAEGIKSRATSCGKWGVVLGVVAGPLMTYGMLSKAKNNDYDSVVDRCYRLRYNRGQVRVDRMSTAGAIGGSLLALPTTASPLLGGLLGLSAGIVSTAIYNNV